MATEQLTYECIRISSVWLEVLDVVAGGILLAVELAVFHTGYIAVAGDEVVKIGKDFVVFQASD